MNAIENILNLVKQGNSIIEIADNIGISRQGVDIALRTYAKKHPELLYDDDFIYKKVPNTKEEKIKLKLTSIICKNKYVYKNYIFDAIFKPSNAKNIKKLLKDEIPTEVVKLTKKLNFDEKYAEDIKKIFTILYPKVIFYKNFVISARQIGILKLVDLVAPFSNSVEDLYKELCANTATNKILVNDNIKNYSDFQNRLKVRPLDETKFFRTCEFNWELKAKAKKVENSELIISESLKITNEYMCGFHLEVLQEDLKNNISQIEINQLDLRVILLDSGKYYYRKGSIIRQKQCEKILTMSEAVEYVLDKKAINQQEIIKKLRAKGRNMKISSVRAALSKIKEESSIEVTYKIVEDINFKKRTGIERTRREYFYSLKTD